jgi:iron(II)-dependent oxidoreductase
MEVVTPIPTDPLTITHPIHLELVRIPAGEFLMGSDLAKDENAGEDEQPQHRVYVSEFYIGKYPVTNEQYAAFINAMKHGAPDHWEQGKIPKGRENHPVVNVSWNDTVAFCEWLSRESSRACRLPTEAEWEKAARGTDGRIYPWGNEWEPTRLNSWEKGPKGTTTVGQYSPGGDSPCGAADMAGNVWEWCADWYDEKEYQRRAKTAVKDPQGPSQGKFRVLRGGSWGNDEDLARCACRNRNHPNNWNNNRGVRVAVSHIFLSPPAMLRVGLFGWMRSRGIKKWRGLSVLAPAGVVPVEQSPAGRPAGPATVGRVAGSGAYKIATLPLVARRANVGVWHFFWLEH